MKVSTVKKPLLFSVGQLVVRKSRFMDDPTWRWGNRIFKVAKANGDLIELEGLGENSGVYSKSTFYAPSFTLAHCSEEHLAKCSDDVGYNNDDDRRWLAPITSESTKVYGDRESDAAALEIGLGLETEIEKLKLENKMQEEQINILKDHNKWLSETVKEVFSRIKQKDKV